MRNIFLTIVATISIGYIALSAFTTKPTGGAEYCQVMETNVNNNIKVQYAGDNKGETLVDDNGANVKDIPYALQVMDGRGWRVIESYSTGSANFPAVTVIMRKEN